jgi:hypothetical protein
MRLRWIIASAVAGLVSVGFTAGTVNAREAVVPAGNLVKNPGGESPFGGDFWTRNVAPFAWKMEEADGNGVQVVRYGTDSRLLDKSLSTAIGGGRNFFSGGYPSRVSIAYQLIDVSRAAAEIDSGGVRTCLSAYLGGAKSSPPTARVDLVFLGEDKSRLGQLRIGPVTRGQRLDAGTLLRRVAERPVPGKTRQLKVSLTAISGGGPSNVGYADNISVALTKGTCDPVLTVKCVKKALVATVKPSSIARTQRVRFSVRGGKAAKQVTAPRAPYAGHFTMDGLSGRLTVAAEVSQAGGGTVKLTKKSRRC